MSLGIPDPKMSIYEKLDEGIFRISFFAKFIKRNEKCLTMEMDNLRKKKNKFPYKIVKIFFFVIGHK